MGIFHVFAEALLIGAQGLTTGMQAWEGCACITTYTFTRHISSKKKTN